MEWKDTKEGRMAIYYLSLHLVYNLGDNAYMYNKDAGLNDDKKIVDFLRALILSEWVGD